MLTPGTAIGDYVVKRKLAEGGMAEVYVASLQGAEGFAKELVIKVVRSFLAQDKQFVQMFVDEAKVCSRLNHANVVQIFNFGKWNDSYFLAMEYVRGASLFQLRKRCSDAGVPFPPILAAEICAQVARGLQYAHTLTDRGQPLKLVHRDVTPHNVLLGFDGAVKLADFGIAKANSSATAPGVLKGKFAYMSPEQARGDTVDARTDVFALGIVAWELLTGGRLFEADSEVGVLRAVQERVISPPHHVNPDVPEELSRLVMKALARPISERFQSAFEVERALVAFVLKTASALEDTSVALFLRHMFPDEADADSRAPLAPSVAGQVHDATERIDSGAFGDTVAVDRAKAHAARNTSAPEAERATPDPRPNTLQDEPDDGGDPLLRTGRMPGLRPSARLPNVVVSADVQSQPKPRTEQMPAHRPSKRLPPVEPLPTQATTSASQPTESATAPGEPVATRSPVMFVVGAMLVVGVVGGVGYGVVASGARTAPAPTPPAAAVSATAPTVVAPSGVAPSGVAPSGAAPSGVAPSGAAPSSVAPSGVAPSGVAPSGVAPSGVAPSGVAPSGVAPSGVAPSGAAPSGAAPSSGSEAPVTAPTKAEPKKIAARPAVAMGSLELKAVPFARVLIDGLYKTDVEGTKTLKVPVGAHDLMLQHPKLTKHVPIDIRAGEVTRVVFEPLNQ